MKELGGTIEAYFTCTQCGSAFSVKLLPATRLSSQTDGYFLISKIGGEKDQKKIKIMCCSCKSSDVSFVKRVDVAVRHHFATSEARKEFGEKISRIKRGNRERKEKDFEVLVSAEID